MEQQSGEHQRKLPTIDEAARPSWEPPADLEPKGSGTGQHLVVIHDHLREEMRRILEAISQAQTGEEAAESAKPHVEALAIKQRFPGLGSFCSGYCELLHTHHSIEDQAVFPMLGHTDESLMPVLKQLFREHTVIAEIIDRLRELLSQGPVEQQGLPELSRVAHALSRELQSHLEYEERNLVPALDGYDLGL